MRIYELVEAPIEDIRTYGNMIDPGSFRSGDLRIMNSPRAQEKIKRVLFRIPVSVVLHVINHPTQLRGIEQVRQHLSLNTPQQRSDRYQRVGLMTPDTVQRTYGVGLRVDPNSFNLVLVENEGVDRYPLTPWIIAHRMKHAFDFIDRSPYAQYAVSIDPINQTKAVERQFLRWIGDQTGLYGYPEEQQEPLKVLLSQMLDTKAARTGIFNNMGEFFPEAFASWCVRGQIGLRTPPALNDGRSDEIRAWEQELADVYLGMLHWGIGKILVL